jgi:hypothetical protein
VARHALYFHLHTITITITTTTISTITITPNQKARTPNTRFPPYIAGAGCQTTWHT